MFVSFFGRGMMNIFPIFPLNEYMKTHFAVFWLLQLLLVWFQQQGAPNSL